MYLYLTDLLVHSCLLKMISINLNRFFFPLSFVPHKIKMGIEREHHHVCTLSEELLISNYIATCSPALQ